MNIVEAKNQWSYKSIKNLSFSISLLFHLLLFLLFLVLKFSIDYPEQEYVELSFGVSGELGSSGATGSQITEVEELSKPEEKNETVDKSTEVKEVELPKAKTTEDENTIKPANKDKEVSIASKTESKEEAVDEATSEGQGNISEQEGSFGFEFESGGLGKRRLLTVVEPTYPDGVQKEINIRLKFSILPD